MPTIGCPEITRGVEFMRVSATGANWAVPGAVVKGMGGAMDLVAGTRRVLVLTDHVTKDGTPKIVQQCTLPLTGLGVVDRIITDRAVLDVTPTGLRVAALAPGITLDELAAVTGCRLRTGATA